MSDAFDVKITEGTFTMLQNVLCMMLRTQRVLPSALLSTDKIAARIAPQLTSEQANILADLRLQVANIKG